jgi:hypothetical protein
MVGVDVDTNDPDPPETSDGITYMAAWKHHFIVRHVDARGGSMTVAVHHPLQGFYTSIDESLISDWRFFAWCQLYIYTMSPPAPSSIGLQVTIKYVVDLWEPQLENPLSAGFSLIGNLPADTQPVETVKQGWNLEAVRNLLAAACSAIRGVGTMIDEIGNVCIKISATVRRVIYLTQLYTPNVANTAAGFTAPNVVIEMGTVESITPFVNTTSGGFNVTATNLWRIIVAASSVVKLYGNFMSTDYTETGVSAAGFLLAVV